MDVLVALGTSAAIFYSIFLTAAWAGSEEMHVPELYFEVNAILITLIILGKLFEALAKGRASEAIKTLRGNQDENEKICNDCHVCLVDDDSCM